MPETRHNYREDVLKKKTAQTEHKLENEDFQTPKAAAGGSRNNGSSTKFLSEILTEMRSFKPYLEEFLKIKDELHDIKASISEISTKLDAITSNTPTNPQRDSESRGTNNESEVSRIKELNKKEWTTALNERKFAFFSALRNEEKAIIFEEFLTRDPPFIPKHCREKDIKGWQESNEWKSLKQSREEANLKHEIIKMKTFAETHRKKVEHIDESFFNRFSHLDDNIVENLKSIWKKDTTTEEQVSRDLWQKRKSFLTNLPEKERNPAPPQAGEYRNRNKQKNTTQKKHTTQDPRTNEHYRSNYNRHGDEKNYNQYRIPNKKTNRYQQPRDFPQRHRKRLNTS